MPSSTCGRRLAKAAPISIGHCASDACRCWSVLGWRGEAEPGVWHLSDRLEPGLRELGERGDIIKSINRSLAARGEARSAESILLHGGTTSVPVIGRVIGKELTDELGDRVSIHR
jgi:type IV secretory pathway VirD2 relaxase